MIRPQRTLHARVWPVIGLVLLVALALSVLVRKREPFNVDGLPGAGASTGEAAGRQGGGK